MFEVDDLESAKDSCRISFVGILAGQVRNADAQIAYLHRSVVKTPARSMLSAGAGPPEGTCEAPRQAQVEAADRIGDRRRRTCGADAGASPTAANGNERSSSCATGRGCPKPRILPAALGIRPGTVKSAASRALAALEAKLGNLRDDGRTRTPGTRLIAALTDIAHRNLPDGTASPTSSSIPPPRMLVADQPARRLKSWTVPVLVAAAVVALTIGALALPNRGQHRSVPPAGNATGTFVTLRARTGGLSAAELDKARQIIIARAAALGAANADVRIVGTDEITAYLPGVAAADVGAVVATDALLFRPLIIDPVSAPAPRTSTAGTSTAAPGAQHMVDQWKSLGLAPTEGCGRLQRAQYQPQGRASRSQRLGMRQQAAGSCRHTDRRMPIGNGPPGVCLLVNRRVLSGDQVQWARMMNLLILVSLPGWQVIVHLAASGQRQSATYPAQHNVAVHPLNIANQVADTVNSEVVVASTIHRPSTATLPSPAISRSAARPCWPLT